MKWLSSVWATLIRVIYVSPIAALSAVFLAGIVSWGGFNWSMELTNTESFCISCHAMRDYVYKE